MGRQKEKTALREGRLRINRTRYCHRLWVGTYNRTGITVRVHTQYTADNRNELNHRWSDGKAGRQLATPLIYQKFETPLYTGNPPFDECVPQELKRVAHAH